MLKVRLSGGYFVGIIFISLVSLGIGGLFFWLWTRRTYPGVLDQQGITTLNGTRHLWSNLQHTTDLSVRSGGATVGRELKLQFSTGRVNVNPVMIGNRWDVYQFLSAVLGQTVRPG